MTDPAAAVCEALHGEVDAATAPLAEKHRARLMCRRGCSDCCTDGLTVLETEAAVIRESHSELLAHGIPAPAGGCAFLDADGGCRIYESRPYVCRTQGLPLRWLEEDDDGEIVEQRDICPLNLEGPALSALAEEDCLQLGIFESRLISLQMQAFGKMQRVELRAMFRTR